MVGEEPGECLLQLRDLGFQPASRQRCERLRVPLAGDQRCHHVPPGDAEDVGGDHGQLDPGVFEQLLHPLFLRGALADQVDAVAGQIA
jgi:hypothetical protein